MLGQGQLRELVSLPLNYKTVRGLSKAGYFITLETASLTEEKLASLCEIPIELASSELKVIRQYRDLIRVMDEKESSFKVLFKTPLEMLVNYNGESEDSDVVGNTEAFLISMCQSVDQLLCGGFPCGRVTELCGSPGVGKTQFCFQLALNVQLPTWCEGLNGSVIYIDTEGNFMPKRIKQMAESFINHYDSVLVPALKRAISKSGLSKSVEESIENLTVNKMLNKIHYIRINDPLELAALSHRLHSYCSYVKNVRLIILDSIAMPFRYEYDDVPQRNRMLANITQTLTKLGATLNATVLFTNQITTNIAESSSLVPALGKSWGHMCSVRLLLEKHATNNGQFSRSLKILKHPGLSTTGTAYYTINANGVRDHFED